MISVNKIPERFYVFSATGFLCATDIGSLSECNELSEQAHTVLRSPRNILYHRPNFPMIQKQDP